MNCHDASRLIDAYVDDELTAAEASAVEAHIEDCHACERLAADRQALARLIRGIPYRAAPERLARTVAATNRRSRISVRTLAWAAAIVMTVSLGTAGVRLLEQQQTTRAIAQEVVEDHVRALGEQRLIEVRSSDQHTVKPWFLGKLDFTPPVDDLAAAGFPLAGGRVDRIDGRTIAVLVYQRRLHPIAVFVWPEQDLRTVPTAARSVRGFHVRHWTGHGMSYWAVSDVNDADLDEFVQRLRHP